MNKIHLSSSIVKPIFNFEPYIQMGLTDQDSPLEEIVTQKEVPSAEGKRCRIRIQCPLRIKGNLLRLRKKHRNLSSASNVSRQVSRAGFLGIQGIEAIAGIEKLINDAYESENELDWLRFGNQHYNFENRLSYTSDPLDCYCFEWVQAGIANLAYSLGLKPQPVAVMALVLGLARSSRWVPEVHRMKFEEEAIRFWIWVNKRLQKLTSL